jgi:molybdate transport system regulatory protein
MKKTRPVLSLDTALSHDPADKRIEILRLVGDSGSISQAAREAGVSYKAAWQAVDTLTNLAGVMLVERAVGGSGGGGATLTESGKKLLSAARLLDQARSRVFAALGASKDFLPGLSGMAVRTSMRNQLPCTVSKIEVRGQIVRVHLALPGGQRLVSRITKASAELLALKNGQHVLALCKATAVRVTADPEAANDKTARPQVLAGQAVRINRDAAGDEISLQLDTGLQLVGFAEAGSGLKARARVNALVEESAVVIALSS